MSLFIVDRIIFHFG